MLVSDLWTKASRNKKKKTVLFYALGNHTHTNPEPSKLPQNKSKSLLPYDPEDPFDPYDLFKQSKYPSGLRQFQGGQGNARGRARRLRDPRIAREVPPSPSESPWSF